MWFIFVIDIRHWWPTRSKFFFCLSMSFLIFNLISSPHSKNQKTYSKTTCASKIGKWSKWSKWSKWLWVQWILKRYQMSTARTSYQPKNVSDSSKSFFYSCFLFPLFELKILFRPFFPFIPSKKRNNFFGVIYAKLLDFSFYKRWHVYCVGIYLESSLI